MTPEQFVYWLQGYMEIQCPTFVDAGRTKIIKDHLALVFKKETPERSSELESCPSTFQTTLYGGPDPDPMRDLRFCGADDADIPNSLFESDIEFSSPPKNIDRTCMPLTC